MDIDYRLPAHRSAYLTCLYAMTLEHQVSPGLVYLYLPELAARRGWDEEQRLWFAFLNGLTQNPITSAVLLEQLPECPAAGDLLAQFSDWFFTNWHSLQFDTDRRYAKKLTVTAIQSYAAKAEAAGGQVPLLTGSFTELWARMGSVLSFGRLSTFSYLEYVRISGYGADCDNLLFNDKSGSRSHRNGMFLLLGLDDLVWDKRQPNSHSGEYGKIWAPLCSSISQAAALWLRTFGAAHPDHNDAGNFTFESVLCAFKNGFYGRRYPGVYADKGWDRIQWADANGLARHTAEFKDMRAEGLPAWLRLETEGSPLPRAERAEMFAATGQPYRAEHFLGDSSKQ